MKLKFEEKTSQNVSPMCVLKFTPFDAQAEGRCCFAFTPALNYDSLIDCVRAYPAYKSYFSEKLAKVAQLEDRISDPKLRGYGETKTFLKQWKMRFIKQINFMINYLGRKNNG
ncbi:MAG: hypothetical protein WC543_06610 [Candidatus Omnitrophota bacterium]